MIKGMKKYLYIVGLAGLILSTNINVFANSGDLVPETRGVKHYTGTVKKYKDLETGLTPKGSDKTAQNFCDSKTSGILVSWVEDSTGKNVSYQTKYSGTGEKQMSYSGTIIRGNVKLNISTAIDQIKNIGTTGRFYS